MTEDFDFDFDVDRGRSASRTESHDPASADGEAPETPRRTRNGRDGNGNGSRANGTTGNGSGNGSRGYAARAKDLLERRSELLYEDEGGDGAASRQDSERPRTPRTTGEPGTDDWLSIGDDVFEPGSLSPLRQRDDGPAGPPTPGEARNFAKEARRRASRRPSPILDFDVERERLESEDAERPDDVDFESVLERQPQKSGVARRGFALRNAVMGGVQGLRRVGGERIAGSRDRVQALRERVPAGLP